MQKNRKFSQETKDKLSRMHSKEKNPFFGKKYTDEIKLKLSINRQGENNPMFNKPKSIEFGAYKSNFKSGGLNIKAQSVYVYDSRRPPGRINSPRGKIL